MEKHTVSITKAIAEVNEDGDIMDTYNEEEHELLIFDTEEEAEEMIDILMQTIQEANL